MLPPQFALHRRCRIVFVYTCLLWPQKASMVINELITTERDYVRDMQSVLDVCLLTIYHWLR